MQQKKKLPLGIKIIIGFHLVSTVLWIFGQGGAVIFYDTVAQWGFQDLRESLDPVIVEANRGIGFADFVIQIPLFIAAVIGLWQRRFYGAVCSWLVLGITIYWPVVDWAKQYFFYQAAVEHQPVDIMVHGILAFFLLFAIWASWYLFKNRRLFE
jgi:hypothetical protein